MGDVHCCCVLACDFYDIMYYQHMITSNSVRCLGYRTSGSSGRLGSIGNG